MLPGGSALELFTPGALVMIVIPGTALSNAPALLIGDENGPAQAAGFFTLPSC